jgi:hypothetical protein
MGWRTLTFGCALLAFACGESHGAIDAGRVRDGGFDARPPMRSRGSSL